MPSKSKKQHNLMALVANNPKAAKRLGIKQSVGEDFMKADKGKKFAKGNMSKHEDVKMDKKVVKKAVGMHDKQLHGGKKTDLAALKKGGKVKRMMNGGMSALPKAMGGSPAPMAKPAPKPNQAMPSYSQARAKADQIKDIRARYGMKTGGCVKMARGGGIEKKGKTKGKII